MVIISRLVNCSKSTVFVCSFRQFPCFYKNFIATMSSSVSTICTHSGAFHCDEVLACYLLKQLPKYKDSKIIRSRDQTIIDSSDIVVDVGGIYDHNQCRYDHHQREFKHTLKSLDARKPFEIKLSSAGLVYHHYGRQIISQLIGAPIDDNNSQIEILFDKIYESFIQEVDAIDNGIDICEETPRYHINSNLSARVSYLIPNWNEESSDDILYERFLQAIKLVGIEFEDRVNYYGKAWLPARNLVKEAISNRYSVHPSGAIIDLSSYNGVPWKEHVFTLEEELSCVGEVKFAVFQGIEKNWRVCAVPVYHKSFSLRLPLHPDWRGLRDDKLSEVSGIPNCIFVHASGFIGGGQTKETCLSLAEKTLNAQTVQK